jgi:hypothetical protein
MKAIARDIGGLATQTRQIGRKDECAGAVFYGSIYSSRWSDKDQSTVIHDPIQYVTRKEE